jgi:single-stranded-DNA-specific exonuclease
MRPHLARDWLLRPFSPEQAEQKDLLSRKFGLNPLTSQLIIQRNLFSDGDGEIQRFLYGTLNDLPNPFLLPDMDRAVDRLMKGIRNKEKILFFGDYDVDGITGTAQLRFFFREIGLETRSFLPHRLHEGYGLTEKSVRKIVAEKPDLLVTIDNGTNARDEIAYLRKAGIDVVVIDHHEAPSENDPPPTAALVNPKSKNSKWSERDIASAGLVFLLLIALRSRLREQGGYPLPNLKRYLDLACLGTIADIVPLTGTNRLIVKYGLEEIAAASRPGLKALMEAASIRIPVGVGSVAFRLAPRINAAGRLSDPKIALDLLLAQSASEAVPLAVKLEELNRERQRIEENVLKEAAAMVEEQQKDRQGIVAAAPGWHLGVVGIVASKLTERFGRPAVVLAVSEDGGEARGSARTVPGLSVYAALKKIEEEMIRFGGHDAAAGLAVRRENLETFARRFDRSVREDWNDSHRPKLWIDAVLPLKEIHTPLVKELTLLEPHGPGNPEPLFMSSEIKLEASRIVGNGHLKTVLCQGETRIDAIGFDWAPYLETSLKTDLHRVAFSPQINEWNGSENIQIKIKSIRPNNTSI